MDFAKSKFFVQAAPSSVPLLYDCAFVDDRFNSPMHQVWRTNSKWHPGNSKPCVKVRSQGQVCSNCMIQIRNEDSQGIEQPTSELQQLFDVKRLFAGQYELTLRQELCPFQGLHDRGDHRPCELSHYVGEKPLPCENCLETQEVILKTIAEKNPTLKSVVTRTILSKIQAAWSSGAPNKLCASQDCDYAKEGWQVSFHEKAKRQAVSHMVQCTQVVITKGALCAGCNKVARTGLVLLPEFDDYWNIEGEGRQRKFFHK